MQTYKPLNLMPTAFQTALGAGLEPHPGLNFDQEEIGVWRLVDIDWTRAKGHQEGRIIVQTLNEDGFVMPNVPVVFSWDTLASPPLIVTPDYQWRPPIRRHIYERETEGSGQIELILGAEGIVQEGGVGGVSLFINMPEYASDYLTGLGMKPDHTSLLIKMQLRRPGVVSLADEVANLRHDVGNLTQRVIALETE